MDNLSDCHSYPPIILSHLQEMYIERVKIIAPINYIDKYPKIQIHLQPAKSNLEGNLKIR